MSRENPGQNKQKLTREERCQQTKARNATRRQRMTDKIAAAKSYDPFTQLKRLDDRLGKNIGAKKERARLVKMISNAVVS